MTNKNDIIVWASLADGSYGGCVRKDLLVVSIIDFNEEELDAMAGDDVDHVDVIKRVAERLEQNA